ncbi:MAG: CDP-archaeol synthase [Spirochaetales bacterium]|jgi:CDP-2,3-bis-(O-geranylgeranyl)-sn-glycerol synthase|nr:CDP-archaeol synthase [Spirochaetales bacterium]MBR6062147.1 CDP-archaeol synthase [Spirochaetales bacterium]MBR6200848.1 CDP-archaeol synthase [Spirochaetales bacterium]
MLSHIGEFLIFVLMCIYTTIPAIGANVAPVLCKDLPILRYPMDFGLTFKGERVLGDHKTFRGLFCGIMFSVAFIYIQYAIFRLTGFDWTLYGFENVDLIYGDHQVSLLLLGFLMGLGVITGDAVKSLFKRRLHIPSGHSFIPWDQVDGALGGLVFGWFAWHYDLSYALVILFATFFLHISIRHFAFYIGVCDSRW